ncbi:MAG: glycosyltransferase family 2 protein [Synergistaceae bacterium]|nr:glycosyltransferase family 2 protein [Synergistaceae bacterium]
MIVDDGATDSTPQICDELANKFNNIKVIHQENKGLAQTRGVGFNASHGEYIAFLDSDDYIDLNAYAKAIKVLEENNLDMVQFGAYFVNAAGETSEPLKQPFKVKFDNVQDTLKYFFTGGIYGTHYAWNKVCRRSLFENIEWPKISTREDACISVQLFSKARKFIVTEEKFYYYLQRTDSLIHCSYLNISKREDSVKASEFVINFIERNFPDLLPEALFHPTFGFFDVIMEYIKLDLPESKEIIKQFAALIRNKYFRMRRELKRQKRKLDMGYDLKFSRKKLLAMKLFAYCPSLIIFALKIYFKRHALGEIKK